MWISEIEIQNIRSLKSLKTNFSNNLNIILGLNGAGKTSILEAIHLLSLGKSFRKGSEINIINSTENFFRIKGLINDKEKKIKIQNSRNKIEKKIKINNNVLKSKSDLIGIFPTVIFSPDTLDIVSGGTTARLSFFNRIFCTVDKEYTYDLIELRKIIIQKKHLLKNKDKNQIDYWNDIFAEKSHKIWKKRYKLWSDFSKEFDKLWKTIYPEKEAKIEYGDYVDVDVFEIKEKLNKIKDQEFYTGRLGFGPQKDEFTFYYNKKLLKEFGSQGEKKFFHYVLKLVEGNFIKIKTGKTPVLLLDDLFAKIDSNRIEKMLSKMLEKFQMFITSTDIHKDGVSSWITKETKLINL